MRAATRIYPKPVHKCDCFNRGLSHSTNASLLDASMLVLESLKLPLSALYDLNHSLVSSSPGEDECGFVNYKMVVNKTVSVMCVWGLSSPVVVCMQF